jgi:hexosaminidase
LHQPELISELPEDIIALNWGYDKDHPYKEQTKAFANAGIEFHVCPGTSSWNSITGRTDNCLANLKSAGIYGAKNGATGYLNTDWGDGGHHQVLPISYVGFTGGAAYSWNAKSNANVDLAGAISRNFFHDSSNVLGQLCLDLGKTLNCIPSFHQRNRGVINELIMRKYEKTPALSKITSKQLDKANSWIEKLESDLLNAQPKANDTDLALNEIKHTLAMSQHAINRAKFALHNKGSLNHLRNELNSLIMSHEDQWLARNRRGGLYESSQRLRNTGIELGY